MIKKNSLWIVSGILFLLVFNVIFFLLNLNLKDNSIRLLYIAIHFSCIMFIFTPFFVNDTELMYGFRATLSMIFFVYFIFSIFLNILLFVLKTEFKIQLIWNILLIGLYFLLLFINIIFNFKTEESVAKQNREIDYIRYTTNKLNLLLNIKKEKYIQKKIERLYDLINSSSTSTNDNANKYELIIIDQIIALETYIQEDNFLDADSIILEIEKNIEIRNSLTKEVY